MRKYTIHYHHYGSRETWANNLREALEEIEEIKKEYMREAANGDRDYYTLPETGAITLIDNEMLEVYGDEDPEKYTVLTESYDRII